MSTENQTHESAPPPEELRGHAWDKAVPSTINRRVGDIDQWIDLILRDEPGPGGAYHDYLIVIDQGPNDRMEFPLKFQKGGLKEVGRVNGITVETLLKICIHRLACFSKGPFPSRESSIALTHLETALMWLEQRTRERMARGVEGKAEK
jgi:hypothetical protein